VVPTLLCSRWQDFDWHIASHGQSAVAELFVGSTSMGGTDEIRT